jgi:hypothetical protein
MDLLELVDNSNTDKEICHHYLELYQDLLFSKKTTAKNVLEIGIYTGGSIKLWSDFFTNAMVYGLDVRHIDLVNDYIKNKENITLYTSIDAYNYDFFKTHFLDKNIKFDFMLDDGPHTLGSMLSFIRLYSQVMTDDGILIIEDVPDISWIEILKNEVPEHLKEFVKSYDLRNVEGSTWMQYDNIVFTIDKLNTVKSSYQEKYII